MAREQRTEDWAGRLLKVASVAFGATALSAALAFYLGWRYEKAYVEEWGLSFSSFSYAPYDLMVASSATLIWAAAGVTTFFLTAWEDPLRAAMFGLPPASESASGNMPKWVARSSWLLLGGVVVASVMLGGLYGLLTLGWTIFGVFGGTFYRSVRAGSENARLLLAALILVAGYILLVLGPQVAGRHDANNDREDLNHLPHVELTLRHTLGLAGERDQNGQVMSGPWRLIRQNDGRFWLAFNDSDDRRVVQVNEADVAGITYTGD